jgi:hypothetical protein
MISLAYHAETGGSARQARRLHPLEVAEDPVPAGLQIALDALPDDRLADVAVGVGDFGGS